MGKKKRKAQKAQLEDKLEQARREILRLQKKIDSIKDQLDEACMAGYRDATKDAETMYRAKLFELARKVELGTSWAREVLNEG